MFKELIYKDFDSEETNSGSTSVSTSTAGGN